MKSKLINIYYEAMMEQFLPLYWILLVFVPLHIQNLELLYADFLFICIVMEFLSNIELF